MTIVSGNNVKITLPNQTFDFKLEEDQYINLEITNVNGEIYLSNKPNLKVSEGNDNPSSFKASYGNGFTRIQLENDIVNEDTQFESKPYNSSIHSILSKQKIPESFKDTKQENVEADKPNTDNFNQLSEQEKPDKNEENNDVMIDNSVNEEPEEIVSENEPEANKESKNSFKRRYMPMDDEEDDE